MSAGNIKAAARPGDQYGIIVDCPENEHAESNNRCLLFCSEAVFVFEHRIRKKIAVKFLAVQLTYSTQAPSPNLNSTSYIPPRNGSKRLKRLVAY